MSSPPSLLLSAAGSAAGVALAYVIGSAFTVARNDQLLYEHEDHPDDLLPHQTTDTNTTEMTSSDSSSSSPSTASNTLAENLATGAMLVGLSYLGLQGYRSFRSANVSKYRRCLCCGSATRLNRVGCTFCGQARTSAAAVDQTEEKEQDGQHEENAEERQNQVTWYLSGSNPTPDDKSWARKKWTFVERTQSSSAGGEMSVSRLHCMGTYSPWVDPTIYDSSSGHVSREGGWHPTRRRSVLRAVPDSNEKILWFREICRRRQRHLVNDRTLFNGRSWMLTMDVTVDGDRLLGNALTSISNRTKRRGDGSSIPMEMWRPFRVVMLQQGVSIGTDMGGLQREWFDLVGRELFSCKHGLFKQTTVGGEQRMYVNEDSNVCNENDLEYFRFAGRLIAMSIVHGISMRAPLCDYIWKLMASDSVCVDDIASMDHELHKYLRQLGDVEDVEVCDLEFKYLSQSLGRELEFSLGGQDGTIVTNSNRDEFVQKWTRMALIGRCEKQLLSMMQGLYEVIPQDLLSVMSSIQIRNMVNGSPGKIDVMEWKKCTRHVGIPARDFDDVKTSDAVVWFWDIVLNMEETDKSKLLQFCTGSSTVPAGGFNHFFNQSGRRQPFTINVVSGSRSASGHSSENEFPTSHTCFNTLKLPKYESRQAMEIGLNVCLENYKGFGFE